MSSQRWACRCAARCNSKSISFFVLFPYLSAFERCSFACHLQATSKGRRLRSLKLNHIEIIEWHEVTIASKDVHESFGVLNCAVAVASGGLSSLDEAKFTLMCVLCGFVPVCVIKATCSLSFLVVNVKALVGVLDDEGVTHRN